MSSSSSRRRPQARSQAIIACDLGGGPGPVAAKPQQGLGEHSTHLPEAKDTKTRALRGKKIRMD